MHPSNKIHVDKGSRRAGQSLTPSPDPVEQRRQRDQVGCEPAPPRPRRASTRRAAHMDFNADRHRPEQAQTVTGVDSGRDLRVEEVSVASTTNLLESG